jgi:hypothetical protein
VFDEKNWMMLGFLSTMPEALEGLKMFEAFLVFLEEAYRLTLRHHLALQK